MRSPPVVKRGDVVTCEYGHVICDVMRDLHFGDLAWGGAFGNFRQPTDVRQWNCCNICGAKWMDQDVLPWKVHVKGMWR